MRDNPAALKLKELQMHDANSIAKLVQWDEPVDAKDFHLDPRAEGGFTIWRLRNGERWLVIMHVEDQVRQQLIDYLIANGAGVSVLPSQHADDE